MSELIKNFFPNIYELKSELLTSFIETIEMVLISGFFACLVGIFLGVLLVVLNSGGILENKRIYNGLDKIINLFRSIPFVILIAALIPITRMINGTSIGTKGAIFPLIIGIIPFLSRQVETVLSEIDNGLIEAGKAMGFSAFEIIIYIYLSEGKTALIRVVTITLVNLINLSAISGVVGAGGLGNFAILRGFQRHRLDVVYVSVILILLLVLFIEAIGKFFINRKK